MFFIAGRLQDRLIFLQQSGEKIHLGFTYYYESPHKKNNEIIKKSSNFKISEFLLSKKKFNFIQLALLFFFELFINNVKKNKGLSHSRVEKKKNISMFFFLRFIFTTSQKQD